MGGLGSGRDTRVSQAVRSEFLRSPGFTRSGTQVCQGRLQLSIYQGYHCGVPGDGHSARVPGGPCEKEPHGDVVLELVELPHLMPGRGCHAQGGNWKNRLRNRDLFKGLQPSPPLEAQWVLRTQCRGIRCCSDRWTRLEPISLTTTLMPGNLRKDRGRVRASWCLEGDPGHLWAAYPSGGPTQDIGTDYKSIT